jgi:hypothetical protein
MSIKMTLGLSVCIGSIFVCSAAFSQVHVGGYTRKDGTYVAPYERTAPNNTRNDNYSTRGNVNPYTGENGTKPRDEDAYGSSRQPTYGQQPSQQPTYSNPYGSSYGEPKPAPKPFGF